VVGPCEHGNEPSGSKRYSKILELLHNWLILKKLVRYSHSCMFSNDESVVCSNHYVDGLY
jgi:hypothetical protein